MSILGNTKKSSQLEKKNSAKLPKLTIQQQIDNNEIIERMNRKITFTKNQRHLGKTMQYVEAFESTNTGSVFRIEPLQLYFTNFQINKIYQSQVRLVNKSKHIQRIKITPLQKKQFVVSNVKYPIEDSGDIAPGMQVVISVRFKPTNLHDIEDQLIIIVGDGVARIPIKGQREKCVGQWPREINCGHCWVGDSQLKEIIIPNKGGEAIYKIQSSDGKSQKQIGVFKIWPTQLKVQKNKKNMIYVKFSPTNQGLFQQKVIFASNQGQQQRIQIKLKGGAYSAQITLDEINNQKVSVKKYHNFLYLNNCQRDKQSVSNFKIKNHAVVPVDYLWYYDQESNFSITPQKGKIDKSELFNFTVKYKPLSRQPKSLMAYLYLYNLPKESIINNYASKSINGVQMIECLKLQVRVTTKDSEVDVTPLHKKITQKLYKNKPKRTSFTIQNNSTVDRMFWVTKIKQDDYCACQCDMYQQRPVKSGQTQQIWFNFEIKQLTKQIQKAFFLVHFDNLPSKLISIEGQVQYPNLQLYTTQVDFQLLRINSVFRKRFVVSNPGQNNVLFKFNNPHRYYHLDFYDFYEFQDQKFFQDRLKILGQQGQCKQWINIAPHSQMILQFQLSTKQVQDLSLPIQLQIQDGVTYNIRVTGQVQQPSAKISQNFIPLKQIFQGNVYNSNKFLPRELSVDNTGNIRISYQIIVTQIEQCLISLTNVNGTIQARSKKRIDMILEPLKTGLFNPIYKINFYDNIPLHPQRYTYLDQIIEIVPENRKKLFKVDQLKIQGKIRGVQTSYYIKDQSRAKKVVQKITDDGHGSVKMSSYSHKSASASRSVYLQSFKMVYPPLEQLNFFNCEINKVEQQEIIIQNNSQLTTEFQIYAENFRSIQKAQSQTKSLSKGMMQGQQLAFTSNMGRAYLQSRGLNQAQKIYLSNNKGISIMCEPSSGILSKKQTQKVVITMFNDTSGRFKDNLIISIKDHEVKKFPINMQIKGTPVSLSRNQLSINFNKQIPVLQTGTFLKKNGKSTRNIKLTNNGPREVQIKWIMYPYGSTNNEQDLFNISLIGAQPGSNNIVETKWDAIKPKPLDKSPFSISPSEKILKGRQEANFILNIEESPNSQNIQVLVIGQPTMIQENSRIKMEQLAIIVQAQIVHPSLKIDRQHANQLSIFQRFAVQGNQFRTDSNNHQQKIRLKNFEKCNLSFSIFVETMNSKYQFFQIIGTSTNSPVNKLKTKTLVSSINKTKTLQPAEIQSEFTLPFESFVQVSIRLKGNPKDIEQWPLESKIRKDGNLIIHFSNDQKQIVPLVGWLYRPSLLIQMPNHQLYSIQNMLIDFGVVHINNHKKKSIYLANPTKSAADWTISYIKYQQTKKINFQKQLWTDLDYQDENITDQKKCFRLSNDSGHILAQSIPIHYIPGTLALNNTDDNYAQTHKPFKLDFVFKPQKNLLYKSKFILKVQHGPTYQVILRGKGTYQQQVEIK